MGVVVALCSELYFMPNQAVITQAQIYSAVFIRETSALIDRMSAKPDMLPGYTPPPRGSRSGN
jgi:hypothetical protein